jgi:hypothetical protein
MMVTTTARDMSMAQRLDRLVSICSQAHGEGAAAEFQNRLPLSWLKAALDEVTFNGLNRRRTRRSECVVKTKD